VKTLKIDDDGETTEDNLEILDEKLRKCFKGVKEKK
jgi:hypothetical protein